MLHALQVGDQVQCLGPRHHRFAGRHMAWRQGDPLFILGDRSLVLDLEQEAVGRHIAAGGVGTGLKQVAQMPVGAGLTHTDIEQVRSGAHGAQQGRIVVVVVSGDRGAAPATAGIGNACAGGAGLLRVAGNAGIGHIDGAATQFLTGVGLERRGWWYVLELQKRHDDHRRRRQGQRHHGAAHKFEFIFHKLRPPRLCGTGRPAGSARRSVR